MPLSKEQQKIINDMMTGSDCFGESLVLQGMDVEIAFKRLNELEKQLQSVIPICPHCMKRMQKVKFKGYYDTLNYWECDCNWEDEDDVIKRHGAYT